MKSWLITLISFSILMTGNYGAGTRPPCQVVTAVTVQSEQKTFEYRDPKLLPVLLNYVRCLKPLRDAAPPDDPKIRYEIHIHQSDGSVQCWTLWDWSYCRNPSGHWQLIDPDRGLFLPVLLAALESQYS